MNAETVLAAVRRWVWLIAAVTLVTGGMVAGRLWALPASYEAQARLQLTAPQSEEVALVGGNRSSNLRDDMTLSRNNFVVALRSREAYDRTIRTLGLQAPDLEYALEVRPLRDTDFLDVVVPARDPELAAAIANTHVAEAIRYYGELRARPASATKAFLGERLQATQEKLRAAGGPAVPGSLSVEEDRQTREAYQLLLKQYAEAALLEENAQRVSYIQVVEPAAPRPEPAGFRRFAPFVGLALLGGLGLGTVLALLLDRLDRPVRRWRASAAPLPVRPLS